MCPDISPTAGIPGKARSTLGTFVRRTWEIFVAVGVVLGYLSYLQPRLSVTPREALDPTKPFSVPFTVANDSYLPFDDVEFGCSVRELKTTANQTIEGGGTLMDDAVSRVGRIYPGAPATVMCNFITDKMFHLVPILKADIAIAVTYRPVFLPWARGRRFRFVTAETADHRLVWLPQPDKPD